MRTPPDWWRELRLAELRRRTPSVPEEQEAAFDAYLEQEAHDTFQHVMSSLFAELRSSGMSEPEARDRATDIARSNLRARFHHDHPEHRVD